MDRSACGRRDCFLNHLLLDLGPEGTMKQNYKKCETRIHVAAHVVVSLVPVLGRWLSCNITRLSVVPTADELDRKRSKRAAATRDDFMS